MRSLRNFALVSVLVALPLLGACESDVQLPAPNPPTDEVLTDFPNVPALPAGAQEYKFPEQLVPAGTEVQTCYYLEPLTEDTYFRRLDSYQGKFGHHAIFFRSRAVVPEPTGTVRDCTESTSMKDLLPVMSSVNFGLEEFPEGMAIRVRAGTQLVIQSHYVNTSPNDVRVEDVLHAYTLPFDEVQVLAGFYGLSDIYFDIPANNEDHTVQFDCAVNEDVNLLMIGPHMHEWGTEFAVDVGPEGDMERLLDIQPWEAWMRDDPPVVEWDKDTARALKAGDIIRTTCVFKNDTDKPLLFPQEMCATYGYFFPANENDLWICDGL